MNLEGTIYEVELARITSSSASESSSENTFCFSDRFSGVHSFTQGGGIESSTTVTL